MIFEIEDHGFKKRHGGAKAPYRDTPLVKRLDVVELLETREIQMKVVQTGLTDFLERPPARHDLGKTRL